MINDAPFLFAENLFRKLQINSLYIKTPKKHIGSELDLSLRKTLFGKENYANSFLSLLDSAKDNTIYRFFDEFLCHYIFFKMPNSKDGSLFFIGPYLLSLPSEQFIEKKISKLKLDSSFAEQLRVYYRNLPVINEENILLSIADTLGCFVWGNEDNFNAEFVSYEISDNWQSVPQNTLPELHETAPTMTLEVLEQTYRDENELISAVSRGKLNKIDVTVSTVLTKGTEERLADSLRNRKNYLIILNTILRKAAEQGEVHPYHIHKLSSFFAAKIEGLFSLDGSISLQKEMMQKYCLLVKEHSLKKYSHLVGKVITLVSYSLSADLSLKSIAETLNINASYLSSTFKKECGETLTDYVHRKRMESAAYILTHSNKQIQAVAEECGIIDLNYFIKIFKKHYGMTPSKYRALNS